MCLFDLRGDSRCSLAGICNLNSDTGPCKDDVEQWFYDAEKGRCLPFSWSGCGGNENRFQSQEECESACQPEDICKLTSAVGPCRANKLRFAFNNALGRCEEFYYGGCRGNANRFLSMETCQNVCESRLRGDPQQVCGLDFDRGTCDEFSVQWYYVAESGRCAQFYYGGCEGNGNRFNTETECLGFCQGRRASTQASVDVVDGGMPGEAL